MRTQSNQSIVQVGTKYSLIRSHNVQFKEYVKELIESPELCENDRTGVSGEVGCWKKLLESIRKYSKHFFIIRKNNLEQHNKPSSL